jgi:hypothetical protein
MQIMKNTKFKIFIGAISILFMLSSCEKWIDTDLNVDPNNPAKVNYNLVLPTIEAGLGYQYGGDLSRPVAIWMQQFSGVGNQPIAFDVYNFTQSDVNNVWVWGMYAGPMMDLKRMIVSAKQDSSYHYLGVAQVLMAFSVATMTDLFGDIPFSDAWIENNLTPKYDSQQAIYDSLFKMIDDAIVNLNKPKSLYSPGDDDIIYKGDLDKWTKAAYTLKARLALHLAKVKSDAYQIALDAIANGFTGNDEDMQVLFGTNQNEWNPAYQYFMNDRPYDIVMGAFFVDTLRNDPRFNIYVDTTGAYEDEAYGHGAHPGQADGFAYPGATFISQNSPVTLMSFAEAKFIEAEAALSSDPARAANAYNDGVSAAFAKYGLSAPAALTSETAASITLAKIIMQKYIALFMNPETFTDYRRTGYPNLTPPSNALTIDKKLPRRWPYPTSERLYNSKNFEPYKNITISDRVWWDKE